MSMQPPNDPRRPSFNNQPTYPNFSPPPRQAPPRQKKLIPLWALALGACLILCTCIGVASAIKGNTNTATPTTTPTDTPTSAAVLVATDTPTDTPIPTDTPTPTPAPTATPTPTPKPVVVVTPTPRPQPTATHCVGVNNNPWCYDFNPGSLIYSPASAFCSYFNCVSTFWSATRGYVAECANGRYTHSGGVSGACSRDGGVSRPLYSH